MTPTIKVSPFELPLSRVAFESALHKGQGRALMHVQQHGAAGVDGVILDSCVHNRAYDAQLEWDRSSWLMQIIDAAGLERRVLDAIVDKLIDAPEEFDHWDLLQCCTLASMFAQRGHQPARRALYGSFRRDPTSSDWIGDEAIVDLDGADGLLFVVEQMGAAFLSDPDIVLFDGIMHHFDDTHGKGTALKILLSAAEHKGPIAAFINEMREGEEDWDRSHRVLASGEAVESEMPDSAWLTEDRMRYGAYDARDVINHITGIARIDHFSLRRWNMYAQADDFRIVAEAMFTESDPNRIVAYLKAYAGPLVFPFDDRLLSLAEHEDEYVRFGAIRALSNYCMPSIRFLATKLLPAGKVGDGVISLLQYNYQPGDHKLIESVAPQACDIHEQHTVSLELLSVFETNITPDAVRLLIFVYEHTPCSLCRERAVEQLLKQNALPDWVRDECRYDACEDIRELV